MKQLIKIAGVAALGLASSQSARAQMSGSSDGPKAWSVAASLRAFYDDNVFTASDQAVGRKISSFGYEVAPSGQFNLSREQTSLGLGYGYTLRYYEARADGNIDQSHDANLKLTHEFTSRIKLGINDSFVSAQEPSVTDLGAITSPLRSEGDNIRNTGGISLAAGLTDTLELVGDYGNTLYDYQQEGAIADDFTRKYVPSRSALLDRQENSFGLNARYQLVPSTVGVIGYRFTTIGYSSNEALNPETVAIGGPAILSKDRDSDKHDIFGGVDHTFNSQLSTSLRLGAEIVKYTSARNPAPDNSAPYVDGRISYAYRAKDAIVLGVRHGYSQTDAAVYVPQGLTTAGEILILNSKTTSLYGQMSYHVTPSITTTINGQYQHSQFQVNNISGLADDFFLLGLAAAYEINRSISLEAGYNYDVLESSFQTGRGYDRNRVFLGVRAQY